MLCYGYIRKETTVISIVLPFVAQLKRQQFFFIDSQSIEKIKTGKHAANMLTDIVVFWLKNILSAPVESAMKNHKGIFIESSMNN